MSGAAWQWWVLSPLDGQVHVVVLGDDAGGWRMARCGHLLHPQARWPRRSPVSLHRRCRACVAIAATPVVFARWVGSQREGCGSALLRGVVSLWVCCPVTKQLHLLESTAVRQLRALGCAVAACGVVITIQDVASGEAGPSCPTCLLRRTPS